jgi:hypothetical protein
MYTCIMKLISYMFARCLFKFKKKTNANIEGGAAERAGSI